MYELVLMMALSNGPTTASPQPDLDTPAVKTYGLHGHREYRHRRGGRCCGCSGGGGGCYGGWGGCSGGWGGCYGGYGCSGGYMAGYGCAGGGGGYGCAGGYAMYGGSAGGYAGYYAYPGMSGYAAFPGGAYPMEYQSGYGPMYSMPAQNFSQGTVQQRSFNPNEATLVVDLPPNARLTIDGQPTQLTSATRTFTTPPLERGREYYYDLKAELNRDGRTLTSTKRVTIRPGEETRVRLDFTGQSTSTAE
jgi:uncharacterized protein (TIGR03000 family)